jgi:hypothetical protein
MQFRMHPWHDTDLELRHRYADDEEEDEDDPEDDDEE